VSTSRDEQLHLKAVELIRAAYDVADGMRNVDLTALNDVRPRMLRYHAQYELVREFVSRANELVEFAGKTRSDRLQQAPPTQARLVT